MDKRYSIWVVTYDGEEIRRDFDSLEFAKIVYDDLFQTGKEMVLRDNRKNRRIKSYGLFDD